MDELDEIRAIASTLWQHRHDQEVSWWMRIIQDRAKALVERRFAVSPTIDWDDFFEIYDLYKLAETEASGTYRERAALRFLRTIAQWITFQGHRELIESRFALDWFLMSATAAKGIERIQIEKSNVEKLNSKKSEATAKRNEYYTSRALEILTNAPSPLSASETARRVLRKAPEYRALVPDHSSAGAHLSHGELAKVLAKALPDWFGRKAKK
jgi:hypothetical protein